MNIILLVSFNKTVLGVCSNACSAVINPCLHVYQVFTLYVRALPTIFVNEIDLCHHKLCKSNDRRVLVAGVVTAGAKEPYGGSTNMEADIGSLVKPAA